MRIPSYFVPFFLCLSSFAFIRTSRSY